MVRFAAICLLSPYPVLIAAITIFDGFPWFTVIAWSPYWFLIVWFVYDEFFKKGENVIH